MVQAQYATLLRPTSLSSDPIEEITMRKHSCLFVATMAIVFWHAGVDRTHAQSGAPPALTGIVSSAGEGAMEGVVVSARKQDSTVTVSVVSDASGRFSFPRAKLEPGSYSLRIRAVGYELDGSA